MPDINYNSLKRILKKLKNESNKDYKEYNTKLLKKLCEHYNPVSGNRYRLFGINILNAILRYKFDDEKQMLLAVETYIDNASDKNKLVNNIDKEGKCFIQNAIESDYSYDFIKKILMIALQNEFNINMQDNNGNTILHTEIYSKKSYIIEEITGLYSLLLKNGFDNRLKDNNGRDVNEAYKFKIDFSQSYIFSKGEYEKFVRVPDLVYDNFKKSDEELNDETVVIDSKIAEYGNPITIKNYNLRPTVCRDVDLLKFEISLLKGENITVFTGLKGVGKTSIIKEFIYQMHYDKVPDALCDYTILSVNPEVLNNIINNNDDIFKKELNEFFKLCSESNIIVYLNDNDGKFINQEFNSKLKYYMDEYKVRIVEEVKEYAPNALTVRNVDIINISDFETGSKELKQVIENILMNKEIEFRTFFDIEYDLSDFKEDVSEPINYLSKISVKNEYKDDVSTIGLISEIIDDAYYMKRLEGTEKTFYFYIWKSIKENNKIDDVVKEYLIDTFEILKTKDPEFERAISKQYDKTKKLILSNK